MKRDANAWRLFRYNRIANNAYYSYI
jgi:hypothetical protein